MTSRGANLNAEPVREAAFGAIGVNYAQMTPDISHDIKIIIFNNKTDKDVYFSLDGVTNHFRVAAGSAKTLDLRMNDIFLENGDEIYIKQVPAPEGAPTTGAAWVECLYV